jgi:hypothetical protein
MEKLYDKLKDKSQSKGDGMSWPTYSMRELSFLTPDPSIA